MLLPIIYQKYLASTGVTTDTRTIAEGNIFFCLKGEKFNGNNFAAVAFEKEQNMWWWMKLPIRHGNKIR